MSMWSSNQSLLGYGPSTAPATGNIKMKRVCFCCKHACFSSANMGAVFSLPRLSLETRRKSPLVPCSGMGVRNVWVYVELCVGSRY